MGAYQPLPLHTGGRGLMPAARIVHGSTHFTIRYTKGITSRCNLVNSLEPLV